MMPGYGETLIAEGDPRQAEERERLLGEFRRVLVTDFDEIPDGAERVLFWPRAAGGALPG